MNKARSLAEKLFYLLVAYLPFQVALNLWADYDIVSGRVVILLVFFIWLLEIFRKKESLNWRSGIFLALAFFMTMALVSFFWAENQFWAARKIIFLASITPVFFLARTIKNSRVNKFLVALVLPAVFSAALALAQFGAQFLLGVEPVVDFFSRRVAALFYGQNFGQLVVLNPSWLVDIGGRTIMRAIGLFPDPHMLAFYLGMIAPILLSLILSGHRRRFLFFLALLLILAAFVLTFSRGGYFGLIVSFALVAAKAWPRLSAAAKRFALSSLAFILVALFFLNGQALNRFLSSFDLNEGSNVGRLANWSQSLEIYKTSPILGVGLGNYSFAVDPVIDYRNSVSSHNLYLDILAEMGIFGLVAWLMIFAAAAKKLVKLEPASIEAPFLLGVFGSLAYFAVHSLFETAMFNPTVFAFFMIYLGIVSSLNLKSRS